jgi:UDP-N-acetylmuramoylalanine--D-glutamate ligase
VLLGGNIGHSLLFDHARWRADQWAVVEVSSFQAARLASGVRFAHAVLTPITVDHVVWHGGLAAYHSDKLRLIAGVAPAGSVIGHASCPVLRQGLASDRGRLLVGAGAAGLRVERAAIWLGDRRLLEADELRILGSFNLDNAALALGLACVLGLPTSAAIAALREFRGLPHRLRAIGRQAGISLFDNGVSTVAETSLKALEALAGRGPIRWVAGGRPKEPDLTAYVRDLAPRCTSIDTFGEVAARLTAEVRRAGGPRTRAHTTVEEALDRAFAAARSGDVLLFSPGFASQDQYPNFAERARAALAWWARKCRSNPAPGTSEREAGAGTNPA